MLWPYIEIIVEDEVKEKALIHSFSGCETCLLYDYLLSRLRLRYFIVQRFCLCVGVASSKYFFCCRNQDQL